MHVRLNVGRRLPSVNLSSTRGDDQRPFSKITDQRQPRGSTLTFYLIILPQYGALLAASNSFFRQVSGQITVNLYPSGELVHVFILAIHRQSSPTLSLTLHRCMTTTPFLNNYNDISLRTGAALQPLTPQLACKC